MAALAGVATLVFILAGTVVGYRLFRLSRRTQGVPELRIGLGLLLICGVAYPTGLASQAEALPETLRQLFFFGSVAALAGGASSIVAFVREVFRPEEAWARGLAVFLHVAFIGLAGMLPILLMRGPIDPVGAYFMARQFLMLAVFGWSAVESALYWQKLRRRAAIGLAEGEVVNRVGLWCVSGAASVLSTLIALAVGFAGSNPFQHPAVLLVVALSGLVSSASMVLAFLPPQRYRSWVQGRSRA